MQEQLRHSIAQATATPWILDCDTTLRTETIMVSIDVPTNPANTSTAHVKLVNAIETAEPDQWFIL